MSKKFHSKETKPVFFLGAIGSEFQSLAPVLCKAARVKTHIILYKPAKRVYLLEACEHI